MPSVITINRRVAIQIKLERVRDVLRENMKRRWETHKDCDPAYKPELAINRNDLAMRIQAL